MDEFEIKRATQLLRDLGLAANKRNLKLAGDAIDKAYTDGFEDGANEGAGE